MVAKGRKKGIVQFSIKPPTAEVQVYLAGAFKDWQPIPMKKQKDGRFAVEVALPAGKHEYKFVLGGEWITDPDHDRCAPNPYGSLNSVVQVE